MSAEYRLEVPLGSVFDEVRVVDLRANPLYISTIHLAHGRRHEALVAVDLRQDDVSISHLSKVVFSVKSHDAGRLVLLSHHLDGFLGTFKVKLIILLFILLFVAHLN